MTNPDNIDLPDIIDLLAGLKPDSPLAMIRDRKPITRQHAQASYEALFERADPTEFTVQERFAIAIFVAGLHAQGGIAMLYQSRLVNVAVTAAGFFPALSAEAIAGRTTGPYGAYPKGPLSAEDIVGPLYKVAEPHRAVLGPRLTAAMAHVHMLVFHPRDSSPAALQSLLDAGWSSTGIVTLSQLVAFLAFQIRAVAGLRTLAAASA